MRERERCSVSALTTDGARACRLSRRHPCASAGRVAVAIRPVWLAVSAGRVSERIRNSFRINILGR